MNEYDTINSFSVDNSKTIDSFDDYLSLFKNKEKALEKALDIRKFEIDLYWKRATYFWAFIALAFAAYFMVFKEFEFMAEHKTFYNEILLGISMFGLFLSLCWFCVNKGAKYWQENWEKHVDLLEDEIIGPLYKTTVDNLQNTWDVINPFCSYKFSVGKINLLLSFFVVFVWIVITGNRLCIILKLPEKWSWVNETLVIAAGLVFIIMLFKGCKSSGTNGSKKFAMKKRNIIDK